MAEKDVLSSISRKDVLSHSFSSQAHFKSGLAHESDPTCQLDEAPKFLLLGTPDQPDMALCEDGAKEITKAMRQDGLCEIVFVIASHSGHLGGRWAESLDLLERLNPTALQKGDNTRRTLVFAALDRPCDMGTTSLEREAAFDSHWKEMLAQSEKQASNLAELRSLWRERRLESADRALLVIQKRLDVMWAIVNSYVQQLEGELHEVEAALNDLIDQARAKGLATDAIRQQIQVHMDEANRLALSTVVDVMGYLEGIYSARPVVGKRYFVVQDVEQIEKALKESMGNASEMACILAVKGKVGTVVEDMPECKVARISFTDEPLFMHVFVPDSLLVLYSDSFAEATVCADGLPLSVPPDWQSEVKAAEAELQARLKDLVANLAPPPELENAFEAASLPNTEVHAGVSAGLLAADAPAGVGIQEKAALCEHCGSPCIGQADIDWIAVGPTGQRDVHNVAHPCFLSHRWKFWHPKCAQNSEHKHGLCHDFTNRTNRCHRPHGPCTDWHLRGKCKRGFACGHCHFPHPELCAKHPELNEQRVLKRPQRRERLLKLKQAYEDELSSFLKSPEVLAVEYCNALMLALQLRYREDEDVVSTIKQAIAGAVCQEGEDNDCLLKWKNNLENPAVFVLLQHFLRLAAEEYGKQMEMQPKERVNTTEIALELHCILINGGRFLQQLLSIELSMEDGDASIYEVLDLCENQSVDLQAISQMCSDIGGFRKLDKFAPPQTQQAQQAPYVRGDASNALQCGGRT